MSEQKKIDERTFDFALEVVAQAAQSKADFISKMSIASKEARETKYWLRLLSKSGYLNGYSRKAETLAEVDSIINIITKIVKTSSQR